MLGAPAKDVGVATCGVVERNALRRFLAQSLPSALQTVRKLHRPIWLRDLLAEQGVHEDAKVFDLAPEVGHFDLLGRQIFHRLFPFVNKPSRSRKVSRPVPARRLPSLDSLISVCKKFCRSAAPLITPSHDFCLGASE